MPEKPLLIFPFKEETVKSRRPGGGSEIISPSPDRQNTRLAPKFQALHDTFESQRIFLQNTADGIDPELALVFETVGSIENFASAVRLIEGFEWLGEIEIEDIVPDSDFYQADNIEKPLSGKLFLLMSNFTALTELISLWNTYTRNERVRFDRGKAKFKNVFKLLKDIRKWNENDRLEEFGIINNWEETLELLPDRSIRFEIELWYRNSELNRRQGSVSICNLITQLGGRVITECCMPEICYHSILTELPASEIYNIINNRNTELVKCENIMFFKPTGQVVTDYFENRSIENISGTHNSGLPTGEPIIAILDGYPLSNHQQLQDRLRIQDPDGFESYYQADDRKHGTAMCSLIIKGDLNTDEDAISTPLYVRPIMRPNQHDPNRREFVPDDILLVDIIHRAVKQMFEGEGGNRPTAPSVKIINLSIGDSNRPFINSMSPCAKLLDWLSYKYKVLFVVSAGNYSFEISTQLQSAEFESLPSIEKEKIILRSIIADNRNRRIMSPSESINSITVGALHKDNSEFYPNEQRINPYITLLPSTYTAMGGGYRRAIKPDFVFEGGRQMFNYNFNDRTIIKPQNFNSPPGHKVAFCGNELNNVAHTVGTSNSAALISRNGHRCYEILNELFDGQPIEPVYYTILIKAMLSHGCSWDTIGDAIEDRIETTDWREIKKIKNKLIGYGVPNIEKVKECTDQRATIIGFDQLTEGNAHLYKIPLPPSLASQTIVRKLTITLAWFSPISPNTQRYRTSILWFDANNRIADSRIDFDDKAVRRGTLQHEIFQGEQAVPFIDGDHIGVQVNCSKDASSFSDAIPYALIVSLEVDENSGLPIYQEIRDRIVMPISVSPHV